MIIFKNRRIERLIRYATKKTGDSPEDFVLMILTEHFDRFPVCECGRTLYTTSETHIEMCHVCQDENNIEVRKETRYSFK